MHFQLTLFDDVCTLQKAEAETKKAPQPEVCEEQTPKVTLFRSARSLHFGSKSTLILNSDTFICQAAPFHLGEIFTT